MGISATTAGYTNTGHDLHLVMVGANGSLIDIENVMSFDSRQETQDITRVRLDNRVLLADLPRNWTGTITYDRGTGAADGAISALEDQWFSGADYALGSFVITVAAKTPTTVIGGLASTLKNANANSGEVIIPAPATTITFYDVTLRQEDAGTWRGDDVTSARIGFRAARRVVTGATGNVGSTLGGAAHLTNVLNQG